MIKARHTPGPWNMSEPYKGEAGGKCVVITGVFPHYYEGVDCNTDEEKANAKLIKEAPLLLECLQEVLEDGLKTNMQSWIDKASAAVHRATS